ncbi:hypothetical protein [Kordia sp.]|uniref:hypothetical protein n=1 Tax=Kordia sp. TaxID=1965332 RepID=UPI003B59A97A
MKKKNLKSLSLRKQSVSNLNEVSGGNVSVDITEIITTINKITKVFSYCPHVSCNDCQPQRTLDDITCVRTYCNDLTCHTCV